MYFRKCLQFFVFQRSDTGSLQNYYWHRKKPCHTLFHHQYIPTGYPPHPIAKHNSEFVGGSKHRFISHLSRQSLNTVTKSNAKMSNVIFNRQRARVTTAPVPLPSQVEEQVADGDNLWTERFKNIPWCSIGIFVLYMSSGVAGYSYIFESWPILDSVYFGKLLPPHFPIYNHFHIYFIYIVNLGVITFTTVGKLVIYKFFRLLQRNSRPLQYKF